MAALICRVYPLRSADGPSNMAADEVLAHSAHDGSPALRFYHWQPATVSLGYFQPAAVLQKQPLLAGLPWVRRPSGGATLVHHHELTYALAISPALQTQPAVAWMGRVHEVIQAALAEQGIVVAPHDRAKEVGGDVLCFQQLTAGDLLCRGRKVVGSAQRKYQQVLLQHGSILQRQSELAPELPGLRELTGRDLDEAALLNAIVRYLAAVTGWAMHDTEWSEAMQQATREVVAAKYGRVEWNGRR